MALESATYISDLVSTNPTSSDNLSQGDDHLRLLKSTIKATFPNVSGAVTATHTELNYVDGVTSALQTQLDAKQPLDADLTAIGALAGTSGLLRKTAADTWTLETASYAPLANPTFTGVPAAPTASADTNTTQLATTAYVVGQGYLKSSTASSTYLTSATASSTYLTSATASSTYATIATVSGITSATTANVLSATAGATVGAVGTYGFLAKATPAAGNPGDLVAGSALRWTNANGGLGTAPAGTWMLMGLAGTGITGSPTLWLRVS